MALYVVIYLVLIIATGLELSLVGSPLSPSLIVTSIVGLAGLKAVLIALFYQHLKYEPWPLSGLAFMGLLGATAFIVVSVVSMLGLPMAAP